MLLLNNRRIILGVSASISIYKSIEVLQILKKMGASVRVVMSEEAKKFVSPLLFESLCGAKVLHAGTESWADKIDHISLAQWGEVMLIAPATANTINKIAAGIADNLLLSTSLAFNKTQIIAPAANTAMFEAASTQHSLRILKQRGYEILPTLRKELVCGITGLGGLQEPEEIVLSVARMLCQEPFWQNREVIVSGGGSIERIDTVRYVSNFSSGKMAQNLCLALYLKGAKVSLVCAQFVRHTLLCDKLSLPKEVEILIAQSAKDYQVTLEHWITQPHTDKTPFLFMAAAISDYTPKNKQRGKLKKEQLGTNFNLELVQNADILASLPKERIHSIGFKLEEKDGALERAQKALESKGVDAICLNVLEDNPLGSDDNELCFITAHKTHTLPRDTKLAQSFVILAQAALLGEKS